jgi:hypothetical protein
MRYVCGLTSQIALARDCVPNQIARNRLGLNDAAHELAIVEAEKERLKKEKEKRELEKEKKGKRRS